MIVIVETTFIIEIVVQQDESSACEEILRLTHSAGTATLVLPAFSLAEAGMTLERRQGERKVLVNDLAGRARNPRGSRVHARYTTALQDLRSELLRVNDTEDLSFVNLSIQLGHAKIIPLRQSAIDEAIALREAGMMTKLPDAIVLTSVLGYLENTSVDAPICFVTPDKAFADPKTRTTLRHRGCIHLRSFTDAVAWIQKYNRPSS